MEGISFSTFWHAGTAILGVLVVIAVTLLRKALETAVPKLKQKADEDAKEVTYGNGWARWYNKVFLYFIPVIFGGLAGLVDAPTLFGEIKTMSGRILFGIVIGWFSRDLYKFVRAAISSFAKKSGVDMEVEPDKRLE